MNDAAMARRKQLQRQTDHQRPAPLRLRTGARTRFENIVLPLALEVGKIGVFDTDMERKETRFSPELCSLLGLPAGTIMGYAESSRIIHEQDRARVQAEVEKASAGTDLGHWTAECRVRRVDGTIRWVAIAGRRTYRQAAAGLLPIRSIGTVVDITHLKKTEAALLESERRLRLALEAARMGTFEADLAATEARIDAQEARLLGLPEGTLSVSVDVLRERIPFEDLRASDAKQEQMSRGEAYHHEFRLRMPDGSVRWLSAHADIKYDRIFGVNFDITRRKLAEETLALSEARFRTATEAAALGLFEWDPVADKTTWGNDRIYKIFGRTRADGPLSRAQFVSDYLHPGDRLAFDAAIEQATRTTGPLHSICRIIRRASEQRWLQFDAKFERATEDKPARFIGVVADITTSKRLERRARRLSQRLLTIQEEERRSIAQELHDSTVQHLVGASLGLTALTNKRGQAFERAMALVEGSLREAITELRTFSYLMHPPALQQRSLHKTLTAYVYGFSDRSGLQCKLRIDRKGSNDLLPVQQTVFRVIQEALANAYRHASATQISIEIRHIGGLLHVVISDNGRGMSNAFHDGLRPSRAGVGIRGIRMRVNGLGGRLRISTPPTGGTRLHAVLPTGLPRRTS
jgi:PAS domain S-box-containing protein